MAYINAKTGCFASGTAGKDAEFSEVGEKQTPKLTFSIAVGKNEDGSTKWFNCQVWRKLAEYGNAISIEKGDSVAVFGKWESNEYNGKIYHNLVVEWLDKMALNATHSSSPISAIAEISDDMDDDDLPF